MLSSSIECGSQPKAAVNRMLAVLSGTAEECPSGVGALVAIHNGFRESTYTPSWISTWWGRRRFWRSD